MSKPSDPPGEPPRALSLRDRLIGLGEHSHRKSYYPELQLRLAELERFRVLLDQSQDGILLFAMPEGTLLDLNDAARRLFALGDQAVPQVTVAELLRGAPLPPSAPAEASAPLTVAVADRQLELLVRPATFQGREFAVLTARDVTARRRMEEALRRKDEELTQSQRLEALGRLAGGVAHDFNNLLTVIRGFGSTVLDDLGPDHPARVDLVEVLGAAERASELTRQLLAFGRKQVLHPRPTEVNAIVRAIERMLRRLIGEQIAVETSLAPDAGHVFVDPGQLEQVLVNLVVNARDAMPDGGRLRVSTGTRPGPPGAGRGAPWVEIAVQDEGVGMDAGTLARVFEPFFTTKGMGRGTGLGLSTVHGIVHQSGGVVQVESEPGRGTTFRVLLPRTAPAPAAGPGRPEEAPAGAPQVETVLAAEDDPAVLRLVCETLGRGGYRVLAAHDAAEAMRRSEEHGGPIHLLVSDVIMPGMSGVELAERLERARPGVRVVFISGYSGEGQALQRLSGDAVLLGKPFTPAELLAAVRRAIAARPALS